MRLKPDSSVPLYVQLQNILASQIASGELRPHQKLPSERELCQRFGISRMTVRQALGSLAKEGLIYSRPGKGVFVADPTRGLEVRVSLAGFSEDIRRSGAKPSSVLMEARLLLATPELAQALHLFELEEVVKVERLRLVNHVLLALHTAYLPHRLCPNILQYNLAVESLFHTLKKVYGLRLARAEQTVRAVLAGPRELKLLGLSDPAPVLSAERTTYLDTGEVIEFSRAIYCGEWYKLHFELDPCKEQ
ncbi:MAG: GntR family transcriptional regulator [Chloroflexi bacterium]|nr:GntR family transcriptional regulator [Chloroflexota bacterium]